MAVRREDALAYHAEGRPGKIQVTPTKPFRDQRDLSLAYTPGVAEPCTDIAADPSQAYRYTARGNLVAVVTNGTAVLGLGNIGPLAGKPVMEGKGVLFKAFADIDVFDLELNAEKPEDVIRFCQMLEPTVGGINLEDIRAPDCFIIEETLRKTLKIPVFHDDQHGTAIISGAALINALELQGKKADKIRVVFAGAGAAAIATAEHYIRLGVKREHILLVDRHGVIYEGRDHLDAYKARFANKSTARTLADALKDADVFVGLSAGKLVTPAMIASMGPKPIVFALANPDPEIAPEEVASVRPDAIVATGRSDYPNQVNNVLGFPFIFRGALDVRATSISPEMTMAATKALASLAREDVPDAVTRAYGLERLRFGRDYIIPKPFDPRVLLRVAPAVAWAAISSGVAGRAVDVEEYRAELEARLGRARAVMRGLTNRAAMEPQRIAFPEGEEPHIVRAAHILADEHTAHPILLGRESVIRRTATEAGIDLEGVQIIDPALAGHTPSYAEALWTKRQRKGITLSEAQVLAARPSYYSCMMLDAGDCDAVVTGAESHYPEAIRPALETIGMAPGHPVVCSIYMMVLPQKTYFFADCTVNIDPDAAQLADIASATARFVSRLGIEPQVAMLSFSNFGSARHPATAKVAEAVRLLHAREPGLVVDGEMQADTAVVTSILRERYPFSRLRSAANVLVFPDLNSANIAYKLLTRLGGAQAIGPILVGLARPVQVLQLGSDASEIVNIAVIAAVDAQERAKTGSST